MTNWTLIIVIVVIVLVVTALKKTKKKPADVFPYQSREKLFSRAERSFLGVLDKIVGNEYRIFAKVRLADIMQIGGGVNSSVRQGAFNRISRKHVDFLITRKDDLSFVGAIELDDKSHKRQKRQARDEFVDRAFGAAGIPICHIKAQSGYSVENVSGTISDVFKVELNSPSQKNEPPSKTSGEESINEEIQACPKCGGELVKRVAKKGNNAGQRFWGCSNFPKCRFVMKR